MADPLSTIFSQVANLVSFKPALRLLIIAGSIIGCWIKVEPRLDYLKIPNELSITLITTIGFSIGVLIATLIFWFYDLVTERIKDIKKSKLEKVAEIKKQQEQAQANKNKVAMFKESFDDYSGYAKEILLKLTVKDSAVHINSHNERAFLGLLESKIVLPLHRIDKTTTHCTINPIYREAVLDLFNTKFRNETQELFDKNPAGLNMLIAKFKDKTKPDNFNFNITRTVLENRYQYSPTIKFEVFDGDAFLKEDDFCEIQFHITDHHYPYFIEKIGEDVRPYIFGIIRKRNKTL
ncbi:hypothetical protein ACMW09_002039 [Cronobacter malonaticus]|nr:hypothetical protein [Cronobacter malonaticus]